MSSVEDRTYRIGEYSFFNVQKKQNVGVIKLTANHHSIIDKFMKRHEHYT